LKNWLLGSIRTGCKKTWQILLHSFLVSSSFIITGVIIPALLRGIRPLI